jgi:hypothetical protein
VQNGIRHRKFKNDTNFVTSKHLKKSIMAKKGKKGSSPSSPDKRSADGQPTPAQTIEYLQAKVIDLTEKYDRL